MVPKSTCTVKPGAGRLRIHAVPPAIRPVSASPRHFRQPAVQGFAQTLIEWQKTHGRHDLPWQNTRDPYRIWVSEIMLQQTQVSAVVPYFLRFMSRFPDVPSLALATEEEVLQHWSGLGYYARARNLHRAAGMVMQIHGGQFPRSAAALESLPGIGRSTAAAIAAFAWGEHGAILDGNVKRVLARAFAIEGYPGTASVEARLWALAESLLPPSQLEAYTQGLMDLGATLCTRARPACERCPLRSACAAHASGRVGEFPAPRPKKAWPTREATWLLLLDENQVLLERRASAGLWGGLWVPPELAEGDLETQCHVRFGCTLASQRVLPKIAHGFTHFRLLAQPLLCRVARRTPVAAAGDRQWLQLAEAGRAALPAPVKSLLLSLSAGRPD